MDNDTTRVWVGTRMMVDVPTAGDGHEIEQRVMALLREDAERHGWRVTRLEALAQRGGGSR
jgi:hypothetical protein